MKPRLACVLAAVICCCVGAAAQHHRDPLNDLEINQLRDTAQEPEQRLKLYVAFARSRLDALQQSQNDPKVTNRAQAARDHLQDFVDVYDELDENVGTFSDRRNDIRKALKAIIEADTEFQSKLRAFQSSAGASPKDVAQYEFLLSNAVDAVDQGAKDHRQILEEQQEAAKHKQLVRPDQPNRTR